MIVNNSVSLRKKIAASALDEFPDGYLHFSYLQQDICVNIIQKCTQKSEKIPVKTYLTKPVIFLSLRIFCKAHIFYFDVC